MWTLLLHFPFAREFQYMECPDGSLRFRWVKAPTSEEITKLTDTLARCIGRFLERQGLLERDADDCMDAGGRATQGAVAENSCLTAGGFETGLMDRIPGSSITYRIAVWPQQGREVPHPAEPVGLRGAIR